MNEDIDLTRFLKLTGADGILVFNSEGILLDSENIENGKNFAAMFGVLNTMATDLAEDISIGNLNQFMFKGENGVFIVNKIDNNFIIGVFSKNIAKAGLITIAMDKINKTNK